MSGRSAYVRKEKTKVKDASATIPQHVGSSDRTVSINEFPMPVGNADPPYYQQDGLAMRPYPSGDHATIRSGGSGGSEPERGYARVQKPTLPDLTESGIEKSSFRSRMDKRSEGVRKGLLKTFGGKKKKEEERPITSNTIRAPDAYELDTENYPSPSFMSPQTYSKSRMATPPDLEYGRPGPPQGKLPPLPQGPQMRRWIGGNRPSQPWNKLRKDPELWDPNGDTLIYFGSNDDMHAKPVPSFRISSHIIERTESRELIMMLRQGSTEDHGHGNFSMPPSPLSSPGSRLAYPVKQSTGLYLQTPPISESGSRSGFEGQISYELFFEPFKEISSAEAIRYQLTIRNVFAILCSASIAGYNLYHTLCDVEEVMQAWMPPEKDGCSMVVEYLMGKNFEDVRDNLPVAASLLAWSERKSVRWREGWTEAFVHCCGMYNRLESCPDYRYVSTIARALLERSALEMQVRVHEAEQRLANFDFADMWPKMSSSSAARESFERARDFFLAYYKGVEGRWPPLTPAAEEQWLNRTWAQKLQADFSALYDILVDRDVTWDGSEERSGRKWNIIKKGKHGFDPDTPDLPLTDILVAFDNKNSFPHIPRPYCRVPDTVVDKKSSGDTGKSSKKSKQPEDKMALKKAQLAYTNSTNIFALGTEYVKNDMVEEFIKFERANYATQSDSYAARRGRWVLIYGILQVLASVSVDSPMIRYDQGIHYHLSAQLSGTPPWAGVGERNEEEAGHTKSYCWKVMEDWEPKVPVARTKPSQKGFPMKVQTRLPQMPAMMSPTSVSGTPSESDSEGPASVSSLRSPISLQSPASTISHKKPGSRRGTKYSTQDARTGDFREQGANVANSYALRMMDRGDNIGNMSSSGNASQRRERKEATRDNNYTAPNPDDYEFNPIPRNNPQYRLRERDESTSSGFTSPIKERSEPSSSHSTSRNSRSHARSEAISEHDFPPRTGLSNTGYAPGIERVDERVEEWPIREQSRRVQAQPRVDLSLGNDFGSKEALDFNIKDFDEYRF